MATVLRCPDCGGILEPVQPKWTTTLDAASASGAEPAESDWRCLLCGYRAPVASPEAGTHG